MKTLIILLTSTFLTISCGYDESLINIETDEKSQSEGKNSESEGLEDKDGVKPQDDTERAEIAISEGFLLYIPAVKDWQDAIDSAPDGYRLISRSEAAECFDFGYFDELGIDGYFWTDTPKNHLAWAFNGYTGLNYAYNTSVLFPAVYISEEY